MVLNAGNAFCPKDILDDASHNFSRRYQKHVLIECAQEYELGVNNQDHSVDLLGELGQDAEGAAKAAGADKSRQKSLSANGAGAIRKFRARTYLIGKSISTGDGEADGSKKSEEGSEHSSSTKSSPDRVAPPAAVPVGAPAVVASLQFNPEHGPPQIVKDWRESPPEDEDIDLTPIPEDFGYDEGLSAGSRVCGKRL